MASSILPRGLLGCFILDKPLTPREMNDIIALCNRDKEDNGIEND